MGIYLPNIEMPTRCGRCDMCITEADGDIDWHNVCCITGADIIDVGEKMVDCPLVPVPEHGDLIDRREAIIDANERAYDFWLSDDEVNSTIQFLNEQIAIIPADPAEEGE